MAASSVLVVEDDPDLADVVQLALESRGYEVVVAHNGREALDRVGQHMPSLILLDMLMPVMDGWQFAQAFSARYGHAAPIVVVTAAEHARQRGAEIDANEVLAKPFELHALFAIVERMTHAS